jgi:hypothetical protein
VVRELFIFVFGVAVAFFLGKGYYESFRSGVLTIKGRTSRRDREPIGYWTGMAIGSLAFLVVVAGTAVTAFLICVGLFGTSK